MVDSREKQRLPCWCFSGELFLSICNVAVWGRSALCEVQMSASRVGGCAQVSATSNGSVTPRSNFTGFPQFIDDQKTAGTEQQHSTECRHKCQWPPTDATQLPPIQLYADTSKLFCFMQTSLLKQVCFMQTSLFCLRQTPPNNPACGRHLQCNKTGNFIQCRNWKRNTLLKSKTASEAGRPNNKSCFSVEISVQDMLSTKFTSLVLIKSKLSSRKLSSLKLRGDFTGCPWKVKKREDPDTWRHFFNKLFKQLLKSLWC